MANKPLPPLSQFQKFTVERWPREAIKNAPYNPRTISKDAERRLRKKLQTRGLLQAITVNRTTGHIVGGHKRLAILDVLHKGQPYSLDVCVVKLTPKQEREENIAFNNPALQGDWDMAMLADMFSDKSVDIDLEETGFDQVGLEVMLGEKSAGIFSGATEPEEVSAAVDDMEAMNEARQEEREEEVEAAKGRRQALRERTKEIHEEEDTERLGWVMFPSRKAREDWVERLGLPRNTRYVPCELVPGAKAPVELSKKAQKKGKAR